MLSIVTLAFEILQYAPAAIKLGIDITETIQKAVALWKKGPATTQDELRALADQIAGERTRLADMTAELDRDND